jgi:hypothetical protein
MIELSTPHASADACGLQTIRVSRIVHSRSGMFGGKNVAVCLQFDTSSLETNSLWTMGLNTFTAWCDKLVCRGVEVFVCTSR